MYPRLHALAVLSPFDQFIWKQSGVRARYISNPLTFKPQKITSKPQHVIYVGRMDDPDKQALKAVEMMKKLQHINTNAKLFMLGPGSERIS